VLSKLRHRGPGDLLLLKVEGEGPLAVEDLVTLRRRAHRRQGATTGGAQSHCHIKSWTGCDKALRGLPPRLSQLKVLWAGRLGLQERRAAHPVAAKHPAPGGGLGEQVPAAPLEHEAQRGHVPLSEMTLGVLVGEAELAIGPQRLSDGVEGGILGG
jgi:hypothetical protein